ncbi:hypothetical protein [Streptomyces sp. NBC_01794]|uniref:hypothetical protein n=1 Tax=Streptomyces sp. NBC_01794 TaxID=2975942 RepID=UPI0030895F78|nr:hypothetical protein OIE54_38175 [Streptomyces sp. NBC_01794]
MGPKETPFPGPGRRCPGWAEAEPLRRLHSGHIGDCVAWVLAGMALLAALALPCLVT